MPLIKPKSSPRRTLKVDSTSANETHMKENHFFSFSKETALTALLLISDSLDAAPCDLYHVGTRVPTAPIVTSRQRSDDSYQATVPRRGKTGSQSEKLLRRVAGSRWTKKTKMPKRKEQIPYLGVTQRARPIRAQKPQCVTLDWLRLRNKKTLKSSYTTKD